MYATLPLQTQSITRYMPMSRSRTFHWTHMSVAAAGTATVVNGHQPMKDRRIGDNLGNHHWVST